MKKKVALVTSFAIATILTTGQFAFAKTDNNMMNGNGMENMMNGNGMENMMNAMNSPEGKKMMNTCGNFMESSSDKK